MTTLRTVRHKLRVHVGASVVGMGVTLLAACGSPPPAERIVPADWDGALVEVRDCRLSIEHDLQYIRVLVAEPWAAHYDECVREDGTCAEAFGAGALVVKPEYGDRECAELLGVNAMERLPDGAGASGWHWQALDPDLRVEEDGAIQTCLRCHRDCDPQFDLLCTTDP